MPRNGLGQSKPRPLEVGLKFSMFILTCSDPGRKGERGRAGKPAPPPILSQLW